MTSSLQSTRTEYVTAANGIRFAYRRLGTPSQTTGVPLVMHLHYRSNMDLWDPLFVNTLAARREVVIFDNAGVGRSTRSVPTEFQGWADDLITFVRCLSIERYDLLGFSMGGIMVQMVALTVPNMVRRLVVAGSRAAAPVVHAAIKPGGVDIVKDDPPVEPITALRKSRGPEAEKESLCFSFFPNTESGRSSFESYWSRIQERRVDDEPLNLRLLAQENGAENQVAASLNDQAQANNGAFLATYARPYDLSMPVLIANGDNDLLIPTSRSWELFSKTRYSKLVIYPEAGHGFIWQYASEFADEVNSFLDTYVAGWADPATKL